MELYLLRHGLAEDPRPGQQESDRKLTTIGISRIRAEAEALKRLEVGLDFIITSTKVRARHTARIMADELGIRESLVEDSRLAEGLRMGDLQQILAEIPAARAIMLVGHQPDLSLVAGQLLGSAILHLEPGGLIRMDVDDVEPGRGRLVWLLQPEVLIRGMKDEG